MKYLEPAPAPHTNESHSRPIIFASSNSLPCSFFEMSSSMASPIRFDVPVKNDVLKPTDSERIVTTFCPPIEKAASELTIPRDV